MASQASVRNDVIKRLNKLNVYTRFSALVDDSTLHEDDRDEAWNDVETKIKSLVNKVMRDGGQRVNDKKFQQLVDLIEDKVEELNDQKPLKPQLEEREVLLAAKLCVALSVVKGTRDDPFVAKLAELTQNQYKGARIAHAAVAAAAKNHVYAFMVTKAPHSTLFVAFRGTSNIKDVKTDLDFLIQHGIAEGKLHGGFANRAECMPPEYLCMLCAASTNLLNTSTPVKRVVLCGHSLGGAVAQIVTLRTRFHLEDIGGFPTTASVQERGHPLAGAGAAGAGAVRPGAGLIANGHTLRATDVACVTFGAPLWGDEKVRDCVVSLSWASAFLNFVTPEDPAIAGQRTQPCIQANQRCPAPRGCDCQHSQ